MYSPQFYRWHQAKRCSWFALVKKYQPVGPQQAWRVDPWEPHEVQQGQVQGPVMQRKNLGILVNEKLDVNHHHVLVSQKAYSILRWIIIRTYSRLWKAVHLLQSLLSWAPYPSLGSTTQERADGASPAQGHKNDLVSEDISYENRLRQFGLFSLENKRLQRRYIVAFQYLKVAYRKMERLREAMLKLDIIKIFFMIEVLRHWNRCPSLEMFKAKLDGALSNLI